ncbi:DUF6461 domain-containing protein [Streptomyces sp. YS-3]|uniref:DUF6461 domain-containing protein n=1 Tax=Streptomyces sp. YS-3 TaxID=3381352 RepID=UPI003862D26E
MPRAGACAVVLLTGEERTAFGRPARRNGSTPDHLNAVMRQIGLNPDARRSRRRSALGLPPRVRCCPRCLIPGHASG